MTAKIFISYRRDDSQYQARMIHAAFCKVIPRDHVFMDVDTIVPGDKFRQIIQGWVNQCEVLLALIGPGWIDARDPKTSRRRLDNPSDFVRVEIREALVRGISVVPVLLDRTPMPDVGLLPDDLKGLVDRQAEFVEYRTFDTDVERLIRKLGLAAPEAQGDAKEPLPKGARWSGAQHGILGREPPRESHAELGPRDSEKMLAAPGMKSDTDSKEVGSWTQRLFTLGTPTAAAAAVTVTALLLLVTWYIVDTGKGSTPNPGQPASQSPLALTTLYSFAGYRGDGRNPQAGLILDASGALYGTTDVGGKHEIGTVFRLAPPATIGGKWTETVLHSFDGTDGSGPSSSLIFDASGGLYGTTVKGGNPSCPDGCGTVFRLTPPATTGGAWTETVLHRFTSGDGEYPRASLISDASGGFYGVAYGYGSGGPKGWGTVFHLTPPAVVGGLWTLTMLYAFTGGSDGGGVSGTNNASLLFDRSSGRLYGTAFYGGNAHGGTGLGTVFMLVPPSAAGGVWTNTVLHTFTGRDGANPAANLIVDNSGALYGTTLNGGEYNCGTVFMLAPPTTVGERWTRTVLYSFGGESDGARPGAGLIFDASGALYSTTGEGGNMGCSNGCGTIFKLTPSTAMGGRWTKSVLHSFTGGSDGAKPVAGLFGDATVAFYGTTREGGSGRSGTVFKLAPPARSSSQ